MNVKRLLLHIVCSCLLVVGSLDAQEPITLLEDSISGEFTFEVIEEDDQQPAYIIHQNDGLPPSDNPKIITSKDWDEITEGKTYDYDQAHKKDLPPIELPNFETTAFGAQIMKLIFYLGLLLLLGLLAYIIYRFYINNKDDFQKKLLNNDEDKLLGSKEEELQMHLQEHLNQANYNESIRYRFGVLLKKMQASEMIIWVPGATNRDYLNALKPDIQPPFKQLIQLFDKACYAGLEISAAEYNVFEQLSSNFEASFIPKSN